MQRVISYVDGFNLYFGLKSQGLNRYLWLDVATLSRNLCRPDQTLIETKYFTSRIGGPPEKAKRQSTYLDALEMIPNLGRYFGRYQLNSFVCRNCLSAHQIPNEKKTDVNIAVELMSDAFQDRFDTAILISADSDLEAPILSVQRVFAAKRVVVAFPPGRFSVDLRNAASAYLKIGRAVVARSQFPETVLSRSGFVLRRPELWR